MDFQFQAVETRFIWILGMQEFVLFVLDDVLYLPLKISDCISKRIQLIWTLGVQELSCYV